MNKKTYAVGWWICLLAFALGRPARAQFRGSATSNAYPVTTTAVGTDFYLLARPGTSHQNFAVSNQWLSVTNIAAREAYHATNNFLTTVTNIAARQAFYATNNFLTTITNIAAHEAFLATNNFINGNLLTNLNGQQVRYPTNQGSTVTMDVGNKYTGLATNNNVTLTGCANIDPSGTNISWGILTVTNLAGSGAVKTITIPAAWVDVDNLGGTDIYNTNQGVLSVMVYPGLGTNFIWRGK